MTYKLGVYVKVPGRNTPLCSDKHKDVAIALDADYYHERVTRGEREKIGSITSPTKLLGPDMVTKTYSLFWPL